jgi:hypothetical protein
MKFSRDFCDLKTCSPFDGVQSDKNKNKNKNKIKNWDFVNTPSIFHVNQSRSFGTEKKKKKSSAYLTIWKLLRIGNGGQSVPPETVGQNRRRVMESNLFSEPMGIPVARDPPTVSQ